MSGRTKERQLELILEYFREMGRSSLEQCRRALGLTGYATLNSSVNRLVAAGALQRVHDLRSQCSVYEYVSEPAKIGKAADLQVKAWRAMRMSRSFTAWDIALYSGASLDYVQKYIRHLKNYGFIEAGGRDDQARTIWITCGAPPVTAPRVWESASMREQHVQDAIDAGWRMMRELRQGDIGKALVSLKGMQATLHRAESKH